MNYIKGIIILLLLAICGCSYNKRFNDLELRVNKLEDNNFFIKQGTATYYFDLTTMKGAGE